MYKHYVELIKKVDQLLEYVFLILKQKCTCFYIVKIFFVQYKYNKSYIFKICWTDEKHYHLKVRLDFQIFFLTRFDLQIFWFGDQTYSCSTCNLKISSYLFQVLWPMAMTTIRNDQNYWFKDQLLKFNNIDKKF